jgi:hypothetical protein
MVAQSRMTRWSSKVTTKSNSLDLEDKIFESHDPKRIAASLKKSAQASHRRKSSPFRSAMLMLTFYINRWRSGAILRIGLIRPTLN